jgi:hypothetical protein
MNENSKGYLNITHYEGRVHMSNMFYKTSLVKDDVNDEVPNKTPKILIPSDGVVTLDGVLKLSSRPEGDHITHFFNYKEMFISK